MRLSSVQNPEIKRLQKLIQKSKARKVSGQFVMEGEREILRAIAAGYTLEALYIEENAILENKTRHLLAKTEVKQYQLPKDLFEKVAIRSNTVQMVALGKQKKHPLSALKCSSKSLMMVVEGAEKPGNIGALLRTAAAFEWDAVLIADSKTDLYNPNVIRSSLGGLFFVPIAVASSTEILSFLKDHKFTIVTAALSDNSIASQNFDYPLPSALVVGSEDHGVSPIWLEEATQIVKIPMSKNIDSLNLSVSAGILMYEALSKNRLLKDSL